MSDPTHPAARALARLQSVLDALLAPDGCPWDQKQTPQSLCDYVVEETFELVEAVRAGDAAEAREELGDVIFILLFLATLFERQGEFSLAESLDLSAEKMIRRHPHVFGDTEVSGRADIIRNWEIIKRKEKEDAGGPKRVFASLPKGLPPLLKAYRINSKAAHTGFTWASDEAAREQFHNELDELDRAVASGDEAAVEGEYGDCLLAFVEMGRRLGVKANAALDRANRKFLARFERLEELAKEQGREPADMTLAELDELWNQAKTWKDPGS